VSFTVGDKVVYPNHGVAIIEDIRDGADLGQNGDFLCLRVSSNDTLVMIPEEKAKAVGLRKLISKGAVKRLLSTLRSADVDPGDDWKERYQENSDLMRTGEVWEVAKVLKGLTVLSTQKELSDRERRMMEKARYLIVSEIAEAENSVEEKAAARVERALQGLATKVAG
jgi:CarD family transcriptional regulator